MDGRCALRKRPFYLSAVDNPKRTSCRDLIQKLKTGVNDVWLTFGV